MKPRPGRVGAIGPGAHDRKKAALKIVGVVVLLFTGHVGLIQLRQALTQRGVVRRTASELDGVGPGPLAEIGVGAIDKPRVAARESILIAFGLGAVDLPAGLLQRRL